MINNAIMRRPQNLINFSPILTKQLFLASSVKNKWEIFKTLRPIQKCLTLRNNKSAPLSSEIQKLFHPVVSAQPRFEVEMAQENSSRCQEVEAMASEVGHPRLQSSQKRPSILQNEFFLFNFRVQIMIVKIAVRNGKKSPKSWCGEQGRL